MRNPSFSWHPYLERRNLSVHNSSSAALKKTADSRGSDGTCHRRRAIDFTSNPSNMTTVTCQRSRIVSPAGIVPIRRYIFVAFRDFFPKTAGRRTASENDQASITRGPSAGRKTGEDGRRCRDDGRPRRRPAIDFLSSSRVYDISPRFDTTRNLSACHACLSPGGTAGPRAHRGAHLFVEENAGRMLPGYRGKAVASYSMKFAPPRGKIKKNVSVSVYTSKHFAHLPRVSEILEDFWKMYITKKILFDMCEDRTERERKKNNIFSIMCDKWIARCSRRKEISR